MCFLDGARCYSHPITSTTLISIIDLLHSAINSREDQNHILNQTEIVTILDEARDFLEASQDNSDSDSVCSGCSQTGTDTVEMDVANVVKDLKQYSQCVLDLSAVFGQPFMHITSDSHDIDPSMGLIKDHDAHSYITRMIEEMYPEIDKQVADSLGKLAWERARLVRLEREKNISLNLPYEAPLKNLGQSEFFDSGLGTSLGVDTFDIQSIASFISGFSRNEGSNSARLPPLSEDAKAGEPFECVACGKQVKISRRKDWRYVYRFLCSNVLANFLRRNHVFQDLRPYTCVYSDCPDIETFFTSREAWDEHLASKHDYAPAWSMLPCPICCKIMRDGRSAVTSHLARHLESISLIALPKEAEEDSETNSSMTTQQDLQGNAQDSEKSASAEIESELVEVTKGYRLRSKDRAGPLGIPKLSEPSALRTKRVSPGTWEAYKAIIVDKYKSATVPEIQAFLRDSHQFSVTYVLPMTSMQGL